VVEFYSELKLLLQQELSAKSGGESLHGVVDVVECSGKSGGSSMISDVPEVWVTETAPLQERRYHLVHAILFCEPEWCRNCRRISPWLLEQKVALWGPLTFVLSDGIKGEDTLCNT
jgi:hypothetical protein